MRMMGQLAFSPVFEGGQLKHQVSIKLENLSKVYPSNFGQQLSHVLWAAFGLAQNDSKGIEALSNLTLDIHEESALA